MEIGFLNINKPKGLTSHDVVQRLRTITQIKRIGHTGTLDPIASGVLVLAIGKATKLIEFIEGGEKRYIAKLKLGYTSKTLDTESELIKTSHEINYENINWDSIINPFQGLIMQTPPDFSAISVNGQKAYKRAALGEVLNLKPREVNIYNIKVLSTNYPDVSIEVLCSRGTYIRSLVRDIGSLLGTGAVMTDLTRTENNGFKIENSIDLNDLNLSNISDHVISPYETFSDKSIILTDPIKEDIACGKYIKIDDNREVLFAFDENEIPVAVLRKIGEFYRPDKVLA